MANFFPPSSRLIPDFLKPFFPALETVFPQSWFFHANPVLDLSHAFPLVSPTLPDFVWNCPGLGLLAGFVLPGTLTVSSSDSFSLLGPWGSADLANPFQPFAKRMENLERALISQGFVQNAVPMVPILCLPQGELVPGALPEGWLSLDRENLPKPAAFREQIELHFSGKQEVSQDALLLEALKSLYGPKLSSAETGPNGAQFVQVTREQLAAHEATLRRTRFCVTGPAGCGKTLMALHRARTEVKEGKKTLLTCYTRALATTLRESLPCYPGGPLAVLNFHDLCRMVCHLARFPFDVPEELDNQPAFYNQEAPRLLEAAAQQLPGFAFDSIVVDEAQDFLEGWWMALGTLTRPSWNQVRLAVFFDEKQNLFRKPGDPLPLPTDLGEPIWMRIICRNTRPILELAQKAMGTPLELDLNRAPEGPDPVWISVDSIEAQIQAVERQIAHLVNHGLRASQISVLVPSRKSATFLALSERSRGGFTTDLSEWKMGERPLIATWRAFRGLESEAVVLADLGDSPSLGVQSKSDLYVAITRARTHLALIHFPSFRLT